MAPKQFSAVNTSRFCAGGNITISLYTDEATKAQTHEINCKKYMADSRINLHSCSRYIKSYRHISESFEEIQWTVLVRDCERSPT